MVAGRGTLEPPLTENEPTRKLTTILSADAAEFSRMMRADEEGTFRALRICRQAIDRLVSEHQGRIFGTAGDSVIAEFASPVEALRCAVEIQQTIEKIAGDLPEGSRMQFRIGVNLGDVMVEGADLIGDGVNVAARIQHLANPGDICISAGVYELVKNKLALAYDDLGELRVKNIAEPVRVHRVRSGSAAVQRRVAAVPRRRWARALLGATLVGGTITAGLGLGWHLGYVPSPPIGLLQETGGPQAAHASIVVLPFENLSGDASQDYFADGITEDMNLALGRFSDLSVIAREATQQYKGKPLEPGELARDLGVRYALQGSVRRNGDQIRVTAILTDALSGVQLWSDRYDGELKDVFAVQDDITQNVVGTLAIKLSDIERRRSLAKPPENLQAYDYLQRGYEHYFRNTRADTREARQIVRTSDRARSRLCLGLCGARLDPARGRRRGWTEQTVEALSQAESLARKTLALDPSNAEAHALLAEVYLSRGQFDLARAEDDQAIALNPNDALSHARAAGASVSSGDPEEAVKSFEVAMRLDPTMNIVRTLSRGLGLLPCWSATRTPRA